MKTNFYMHKKLNISNIGYGFFTKIEDFSKDNYAFLAYDLNAVTYDEGYRYIINAHTGEIIRKWSLVYHDGPTIGSGENLLGEFVDELHSIFNLITQTKIKGDGLWVSLKQPYNIFLCDVLRPSKMCGILLDVSLKEK